MPFTSLLSSPAIVALTELQKKFVDARNSLIRIRTDRTRLARSGWRPRVPSETKLIRAAEWATSAVVPRDDGTVDFDLESRFVPSEAGFREAIAGLERARGQGKVARVSLRGIELDEPRFLIDGRAVVAAFFDLVLVLSRSPDAVIVLPKVDGYLEARLWAEAGRAAEVALGLRRESIRFEAAIDTLGGVVEAEEILFELKDSVVGLVYDVRLDRFDSLKMESGTPNLPCEDFAHDPWAGIDIASRAESLETVARKRGVRLELRPGGGPGREPLARGEASVLTLDSLHAKASFAFRFLREWFSGNSAPEGKDFTDFELARALVWTAMHSGFLREENYDAWREEFGASPFAAGSVEEAAIRTFDPLVRTAVFPDSAKPLAFSILLEREKMHRVSAQRLA